MHEIPLSIGRHKILAYKFHSVLVLQAWKGGNGSWTNASGFPLKTAEQISIDVAVEGKRQR